MRGRPRSLMIGAVVAAAMSTAAIAFTGAQVQASAIERRLASDLPETQRRRVKRSSLPSSRKGNPGRPKKHRRRRPPRSWRRARAAKLRSRK